MKIEKIKDGFVVTEITEQKLREALGDEEENSCVIASVDFTKRREGNLQISYGRQSLYFSRTYITRIHALLHKWFPEHCI